MNRMYDIADLIFCRLWMLSWICGGTKIGLKILVHLVGLFVGYLGI